MLYTIYSLFVENTTKTTKLNLFIYKCERKWNGQILYQNFFIYLM